eukprot:SAG31_NODE_190_length_20810_cov_20.296364_19_plen_68_part_00
MHSCVDSCLDLYNEPSGGGLKQQRRRGLRHMRTALKQLIESGEPARPDYFYALGEIHAGTNIGCAPG